MQSKRLRRFGLRYGVVAVLIVVALIATAPGGGRQGIRVTGGPTPSVTVTGATPAQEDLLRAIVREVPGPMIKSVAVGAPPAGFDFSGAWLSITVEARDGAASVRAQWQALVVAGLFRDLSASRGLPAVTGKTITAVDPAGAILDGPATTPLDSPPLDVPSTTTAALATAASRGAARAGLAVASIRVARPVGQPVIELTVEADDPALFTRSRNAALHSLLRELYGRAEGTYVEVVDRGGNAVLLSAFATRLGEGVGWTQPAYDRSSITRGLTPHD